MTQSSATQRGSESADVQFSTDRTHPGRWTITFSNPPINVFLPTTIVELGELMTDLEADPSVKVVVFQSANPDFFIAHLDVAKAAERPEAPNSHNFVRAERSELLPSNSGHPLDRHNVSFTPDTKF